ncbi:hypothetical protein BO78DRAFT_441894 [Aspergillus sclerotiicarbonarius CBS 121057]|uniref:P-loop containing nucleoside triphosphate hydrolase protein n=1 Tax=Aspergillus sclerotiicarbonarius (strain CBS 121057 / IBT 28362) TaxID=1448318 RepID=A0A319EFS4_ASPSB|nr:hypothetical protein BO78DRAFT_441894 [Aspergillus sclerotiicarbonarius CBS 121057]
MDSLRDAENEISESFSPCSAPFLDDSLLEEDTVKYHMSLLPNATQAGDEGFEQAPIVSSSVLNKNQTQENKITQYGLLAATRTLPSTDPEQDPRLFFNISHPSSVFICGSQASGKSHTLSCLLENCLIPSKAGRLPNPLTAVVFHYDTFISDDSGYPCEAAFLSSHPDVKVRVLCSPTNFWTMKQTYSKFNITVEPLHIDQKDLNTKRMMDLMAVSQTDGDMPLYMHTVKRILRQMRIRQQEAHTGFSYTDFKARILSARLTPAQVEPLKQRLDTLESFMAQAQVTARPSKDGQKRGSLWDAVPGLLTIVDLSCPCISPETACSLFNICLGIFLKPDQQEVGRVIALDEAHKFMTTTPEARTFTETLLSSVRLQRHLGARIIISTQEPTISTALLNLCTVIIVHRFTSPEWLRILQKHVAGAAMSPFTSASAPAPNSTSSNDAGAEEGNEATKSLFERIVRLGVGEALVFAPSAVVVNGQVGGDDGCEVRKLGEGGLRVMVRKRLTVDGGKSVLSG